MAALPRAWIFTGTNAFAAKVHRVASSSIDLRFIQRLSGLVLQR
jgi:hypothetical protein